MKPPNGSKSTICKPYEGLKSFPKTTEDILKLVESTPYKELHAKFGSNIAHKIFEAYKERDGAKVAKLYNSKEKEVLK